MEDSPIEEALDLITILVFVDLMGVGCIEYEQGSVSCDTRNTTSPLVDYASRLRLSFWKRGWPYILNATSKVRGQQRIRRGNKTHIQ